MRSLREEKKKCQHNEKVMIFVQAQRSIITTPPSPTCNSLLPKMGARYHDRQEHDITRHYNRNATLLNLVNFQRCHRSRASSLMEVAWPSPWRDEKRFALEINKNSFPGYDDFFLETGIHIYRVVGV